MQLLPLKAVSTRVDMTERASHLTENEARSYGRLLRPLQNSQATNHQRSAGKHPNKTQEMQQK
jgi:hypothetical protein